MKRTLFLYNFAKVFIPGAILLCIIFGISDHIPNDILKITKPPLITIWPKKINLPKQSPSIIQESVIKPAVPKPEKPINYVYIVEFKSGGTMKAKGVSLRNNIVTLFVDDGYSVQISKNDIQKINKMRL